MLAVGTLKMCFRRRGRRLLRARWGTAHSWFALPG